MKKNFLLLGIGRLNIKFWQSFPTSVKGLTFNNLNEIPKDFHFVERLPKHYKKAKPEYCILNLSKIKFMKKKDFK